MQALLDVILPVFLVIAAGYVLVWRGYFPAAGIDGVMKFTQGFAIPCLLFQAIARIDLSATFHPGLLAAFYIGAGSGFVLGMLGARFLLKRDWEDSVVIGFACLFSNSVLLGLAITERAYGPGAMAGNFAIVALHSPFCYGLGITVMEVVRNRGKAPLEMAQAVLRAMFRNALVIGIVLGFAVNLSGVMLPTVLSDALDLIVRAALPAALFALGGVLYQYRPEGDKMAIAMVCAIALLIHPAITWSLGTLWQVPQDLFRSAVVTAAMAPGFNAYIFADMYGRARRVAASAVLIATAASVFTAWGWLVALG
ncbi:MAG: AEC family transporter [Pseudomonadota bacterium]